MNNIKILSEALGLSNYYIDKMGITHNTDNQMRNLFIKSFHLSKMDMKTIPNFCWYNGISPSISFFENDKKLIDLYLDTTLLDSQIIYKILQNDKVIKTGVIKNFQTKENKRIDKKNLTHIQFELPLPKDFGYYSLKVFVGKMVLNSFIIYAPQYAYFPKQIEAKQKKLLGLGIQLYALRSKNDMGVGNFTALENLIKYVADKGCDFIGLNPLGAMYNKSKSDVSPYRALSREYLNYLYLDLPKQNDFKQSEEVSKFIKSLSYKKQVNILENSDKVDYFKTFQIKTKILKMMFNHFYKTELLKNSSRAKKFYKFASDTNLVNLCLFESLLETNDSFWGKWKTELKNITPDNLEKLKKKYQNKIYFYAYTHWLCDIEIKKIKALCEKLKMKVGLYLDIPTGASSNSAEVWQNKNMFALDYDIGTPPDTIRPKGQTWGLTPLKPFELQQNYQVFISLITQTMQYAGAIRLDHSFSLMRLFWVNKNAKGAYIYYNMKDLVAILTLESHKHKCIVIGEDLGNVPDGFREFMAQHKILSNKILFRQKDKDGAFLSTTKYPYFSLAQVSTHDQATSCGFWIAEDIKANNSCHLYPKKSQYETSLETRNTERIAVIRALKRENCFVDNSDLFQYCLSGDCVPENLALSFNKYGAKSKSALFMIRIEDIVGQTLMQNVPSTVDEYPNWRIKLPFATDNLKNLDFIKDFIKEVKKERK